MLKMNRITKLLVCAGMTTLFLGCASPQKKQSSNSYNDDNVITTNAIAAISNDTMLKKQQINVKTYKGEVQLTGDVDTKLIVKRAEEAVGTLNGVTSVKNDLVVK